MRRFLLIAAFFLLAGMLWLIWQARYERDPGMPVLRLDDVRQVARPVPGMEWSGDGATTRAYLTVTPGAPPLAVGVCLPFPGPVEQLHVKCRMQARDLVRGKNLWEDGRVMIEWRTVDGSKRLEIDPVVSGRENDFQDLEGVIIGQAGRAGVPVLRFEHLGAGGSYEVFDLEVTAVRERALWSIGSWAVAVGWGMWMFWLIRSWRGIPKWRAALAAAIGLVTATQLVVPGPWKSTRPMVAGFHLGAEPPAVRTELGAPRRAEAVAPAVAGMAGRLEPEGKLPYQGSLILKVKLALAAIRPVLHMFLLFGPALVMFCLVGRRPGLLLMVMLALGVELAQMVFGYGFDTTDLWDLTNDAIGIAAAAGVHALLGRRFGSRIMWRGRDASVSA